MQEVLRHLVARLGYPNTTFLVGYNYYEGECYNSGGQQKRSAGQENWPIWRSAAIEYMGKHQWCKNYSKGLG